MQRNLRIRHAGLKLGAGIAAWVLSSFAALGQTDALDHWTTNLFAWIDHPGLRDVTCGQDRFVAVGAAGNWALTAGYVVTSEDGLSWTVRVSENSTTYLPALLSVTYGNGLYVAVGEEACVCTSTNGINWVLRSLGPTTRLYCVTYGNGLFVAVGDCYLSSSGGYTRSNILVSADGQTWTPCPSTTETPAIIYSVAFGNGRFAAIGSDASSYSSTDGTNWTRGYTYSTTTLNFCNGLFIQPISAGHFWVSSNAVNWAHMTVSPAAWFGRIVYDSGLYVAIGLTNQAFPYTNTVLTSVDGTNWLLRSVQYAGDLTGVTFGRSRVVVVGRSSGNSAIFTSDPLAGIDIRPSVPPELRISGLLGRSYRVEFANALPAFGTSEWQTLTTLTLTNNPTATADPRALTLGRRFYRSVLLKSFGVQPLLRRGPPGPSTSRAPGSGPPNDPQPRPRGC